MLNSDYKVIAKALDNRLRVVLPKLIPECQMGFMKGRNISTNIRKSLDIIEYTRQQKIPAIILSVDLEKAFDLVDYSAIKGVLKYFNFGESFTRWTMLFYTHFEVCTQNFGYFSDFFEKSRSTNQGCIISPAIFLLISAVLTAKIKSNSNIKGIKIGEVEYLLSQFADDMDLYLPYDKIVLNTVLSVFSEVETNTGLRVSYDKTSVYRIGSITNTNAKFYTTRKLTWTNDPVNTLGIDLYQTEKELMRNYERILLKVKTICELWYYRNLSLIGKVLVINTLMSSIFMYRLQVLPQIPESVLKEYQKMVETYLWKNKKPKIPYNVLTQDKMLGGLGLVDLNKKSQSLAIVWIQNIEKNGECKNLAKFFLGSVIEENFIWKCNLSKNDAEANFKQAGYWKHVLQAWCTLNFQIPQSKENIMDQIIWYNSNIRMDQKILKPNSAIDMHLCVKDFWANTRFKTFQEFQRDNPQTKITWLSYHSIVESIPKYWKYVIANDPDVNDDYIDYYLEIEKRGKCSQYVYKCPKRK